MTHFSLFQSRATRRTHSNTHRRSRPIVETLEGRRLLSGGNSPPPGISLNAYGTLNIIGDARVDNALVWVTDNTVNVALDQLTYVIIPGLPPKALKESHAASYPLNNVKSIYFFGAQGNDSFNNGTSIPCNANGAGGNDILSGGFGNDSLYGGEGDDQLEGRSGDDLLNAGAGNDTYLFAGMSLGTDTIKEADNLDTDTLDFTGFKSTPFGLPPRPFPITLDLSRVGPQVVNAGKLTLDLSGAAAIENVAGTGAGDMIQGNARNNLILGYGGNDSVFGLGANDSLYGGDGNDILYGGDGNDLIDGGTGDDSINGGAGVDSVYGGDGNDALLGGAGIDNLHGQAGVDRFLQQKHLNANAEDTIADQTTSDAVILFSDQPNGNVAFGWKWSGGTWSETEIMDVNDALGSLVKRVNGPALLKGADGSMMTFARYGVPTEQVKVDSDKPDNVGAWNNGSNGLNFPNATFGGSKNWMMQIIQHEIGHNWNPQGQDWTDWLALSGWKLWDPNQSYDMTKYNSTTNYGETWLYLKSATFANEYGKTHPYEDFATAFEDYFAHYEGRAFINQLDEIPDKFAYLDTLFNALS